MFKLVAQLFMEISGRSDSILIVWSENSNQVKFRLFLLVCQDAFLKKNPSEADDVAFRPVLLKIERFNLN